MKIIPAVGTLAASLLLFTGTAMADVISIDAKWSFYRLDNNDPEFDPVPINLSTLSFTVNPGDTLRLTRQGNIIMTTGGNDTFTAMVGAFSSNNTILNGTNQHRIPGAVDAGAEFVTGNTLFGGFPTDFAEDFLIDSNFPATPGFSTVDVVVPANAHYLFVISADGFHSDNSDPNGNFAISITPAPEPSSLILLTGGFGLLLAGFKRKARA